MTATKSVLADPSYRGSQISVLNPLKDSRWGQFVEQHPDASVFHTVGWLGALHRTYGYEPVVVTTSVGNGPLSNGLVVCKVNSWATGNRLVSLPFSDHCEPLVKSPEELEFLTSALKTEVKRSGSKYVELRPLLMIPDEVTEKICLTREHTYCVHRLELNTSLDTLYSGFHPSCVQRKIRKAERLSLDYEEGCSEEMLSKFYALLLRTRRRHQLPPQSRSWFRNLATYMGEKMQVRVASFAGKPVAAIVTCQHRDTMMYKYGCSDAMHNNLGGGVLLIWRALQDAHARGMRWFDFGRTSLTNAGLITFKKHWGASMTALEYYRFPDEPAVNIQSGWKRWVIERSCAHLPDPLLETLGALLYRHAG